jgi:histidyl-tRNA synthetase
LIKSIRGTQDILPGSVESWQRIETTARRLFKLYGYGEVRTPILENTELFSRTIGTETDIVQKEMYSLAGSKGKTLSLRPEGTAPVVRAYLQHGLFNDGQIDKLYYIGPMFRRERPQKGRYRQFHQIGAEVLGSDHPAIEAEVIDMLSFFLQEVGFTSGQLLINSVGDSQCRPSYIKHLKKKIDTHLSEFCSDCRRRSDVNPLRVLDCKSPSCQPLIEQLPSILDHLCPECCQHFDRFRHYLDLYGISYRVEPRLVRGLDYYIRTTFEMIDERIGPTQNAILGGGRYDGLSELLGGPNEKGFGFALGIERLALLLSDEKKVVQNYQRSQPDIFLAYLDETSFEECFKIVRQLRSQQIAAYLDFEPRSLKAQMRLANRLKTRYVCVVGLNEIDSGTFSIKQMSDGSEVSVKLEEIAEHVKEK